MIPYRINFLKFNDEFNIWKCTMCNFESEIKKPFLQDQSLFDFELLHLQNSPNCIFSLNIKFADIKERERSFLNWNHNYINSTSLAKAGFFYLGVRDLVQCFKCGLKLQNWGEFEDPFIEHKKFNPNCVYKYEEIYNNDKCSICLKNKKNVCFIPCGHICSCINCASNLLDKQCLICNRFYLKAITTFY